MASAVPEVEYPFAGEHAMLESNWSYPVNCGRVRPDPDPLFAVKALGAAKRKMLPQIRFNTQRR